MARVVVGLVALVVLATGAASGAPLALSAARGEPIPAGASTLFAAGQGPTQTRVHADLHAVELGVRLEVAEAGQLTGLRYYRAQGDTSAHRGTVWSQSGRQLAVLTFPASTAVGWQNASFGAPLDVRAGSRLTVSYHTASGYAASNDWFDRSAAVDGPVTWVDGARSGVYAYGQRPTRPATVHRATNYWIDVLYSAGTPTSSRPAPPAPQPAPVTTTPPAATTTPDAPAGTATPTATTTSATPSGPAISAPIAAGQRATPGGVGFLGDRSTLTVVDGPGSAPAGTEWRDGTLAITRSGVVLDHVWVRGSIDFGVAGSLVVRNSVVEANGRSWSVIGASNTDSTLEVTDSTVSWPAGVPAPGEGWGNGAIHGDARMTITRTDISGTPDGIQQGSGNSTFQQNWIHDLAKLPWTHNDGIQLYGGPGVVVVGNHIDIGGYHGTENAAVFLSDDGDGFTAPVISDNYLSGGGYQLRLESGVTGAVVSDNDFGPLAGGWGEILVSEPGAIASWSVNRDINGNQLVEP